MRLLIDGKDAFERIIELISETSKCIHINMFIWRNDEIGRRIAEELVGAADRGVSVSVSKDRYGAVLEYCEECKSSFFHRKPTGFELLSSYTLEMLYGLGMNFPKNIPAYEDELYSTFISHPNITVEDAINKYDHSKFYIFDNKTIVLGGINIEDKELTIDCKGQHYHDYMVEITESDLVFEFTNMIFESKHFMVNRKKPVYHFEMRESYLDIINRSEDSLYMLMAYISWLPDIMNALLNAAKRGVDVRVLIPISANFQDDLNKKCIKKLIKESGGMIKAYLYPEMIHAKLVMSEKTISIGSANITKKAFRKLDELNFVSENDDSDFAKTVRDSVADSFKKSELFPLDIKYNTFRALLESIVM